jgi:hypothetical protein
MSRGTLRSGLPTLKAPQTAPYLTHVGTWHTSAKGPPPASTQARRAWRLAAGAIEPRLVPVTLKHPKGAKRRLTNVEL